MARTTLQDLAPHEVELPGGHVYTVNPATRSVVREARAVETRLEQLLEAKSDTDLSDEDLDALVAVYCEMLNVRLRPAKPRQQHAGTVVTRLWESDEITVPQLEQLLGAINETDRPT